MQTFKIEISGKFDKNLVVDQANQEMISLNLATGFYNDCSLLSCVSYRNVLKVNLELVHQSLIKLLMNKYKNIVISTYYEDEEGCVTFRQLPAIKL